nr:cytochrome P450 9e2-like [Nomia melanderi]
MIDAWTVTSALLVVGAAAIYYYLKTVYSFFNNAGIPAAPSLPVLGSMWKGVVQKCTFAETVQQIYNVHPEAQYVGFFDFHTPMIMIRDLELLKSITVKNFEHFQDHRAQTNSSEPLFSKNLFFLRGEKWKEMRTMLSRAFTSSKMKAMYELMRECAVRYGEILATVPVKERSMELKDTFTRYTNDVIATCAFGVTADSMSNRNNSFYVYGRRATHFGRWRSIKFFLMRNSPRLFQLLGMKLMDKESEEFYQDLISSTIKARDEQGIVRPDMIQLMMETRGKLGPGKELTIEDMTAQAFVFFFGGFESTSTMMCFAAYEVGVNPEVQKRLQEEIDGVLENGKGKVTYEAINDMKYLDAIINEALRMYPVVFGVDRVCTKPFELPPALPGGKPHLVKKDEYLWIPIYPVQSDPQYFEEPTKFNPDRFLDDPKKILNSGMFLTFGLGPRMCIGNRFALLESKVLLFHVFARCNLKPNERTPIPMKLGKGGVQMSAEGGFWFDVVPRKIATPVLVNSASNGNATY